jgi:hypothetical protein
VLVSSTVRDLVAGSGLSFDDRGSQSLKRSAGEGDRSADRSLQASSETFP